MDNIIQKLKELSPAKLALLGFKKMDEPNPPKQSSIAVIGMAGRFPGNANTPEKFWENLKSGLDCITELPAARAKEYQNYQDQIYCSRGGYLERVDQFDAGFFKVTPAEARVMDPQQRQLLEVSYEAFENAGLTLEKISGSKTGVFMGVDCNEYAERFILDPQLVNGYLITGNSYGVCAGRLSFFYNLKGPSVSIDVGCSSSLLAAHYACLSLLNDDCEVAVIGGVSVKVSPIRLISRCDANMISKSGRCHTFDNQADGYVPGEGCGIFILKRLDRAIKDQDRILATIESIAVNQDGASSSLTAPNGPAQAEVIQKALEKAGLSLDELDYIETHGTGTYLGDPIEIQALGQVFFGGHKPRTRPLVLGSVKTNIGHLEAAAGMASLTKVILALQHQTIPGNLHQRELNNQISWNQYQFTVPDQAIPWEKSGSRYAGVSCFSFMGTNAHLIIKEYLPPAGEGDSSGNPKAQNIDSFFIVVTAKTPESLRQSLINLLEFINKNQEIKLTDLSYTYNLRRTHFKYRTGFVISSLPELRTQLEKKLQEKRLEEDDSPGSREIQLLKFKITAENIRYYLAPGFYGAQTFFKNTVDQLARIVREKYPLHIFPNLFEAPVNQEVAFVQGDYLRNFVIIYALVKLFSKAQLAPELIPEDSLTELILKCAGSNMEPETSIEKFFDFIDRKLELTARENQTSPEPAIPTDQNASSQNLPQRIDWSLVNSVLKHDSERGLSLKWKVIYDGFPGELQYLPNYPFQKTSYWIERTPGAIQNQEPNASLFIKHEKTGSDDYYYTTFNERLFPILNDHLLFNKAVVSGPTQITLILQALESMNSIRPIRLDEYTFFHPIIIEGKERTGRITFSAGGEIQIHSRSEVGPPNPWVMHSLGRIDGSIASAAAAPNSPADLYPVQKIIQQCSIHLEPAVFYKILSRMGYSFGSSFKCMEYCYRGENQALGIMTEHEQGLDPGLVDSGIQVMLLALPQQVLDIPNTIYVPFYIQHLAYYRPFSGKIYCHARINDYNPAKGLFTGTITFLNEAHEVVLEIEKLILKQGRPESLLKNNEPVNEMTSQPINHISGSLAPQNLPLHIGERLRTIVARILEVSPERIDPQENFVDYGFESLSLLKLSEKINEEFQVRINPNQFYQIRTVSSLGGYLAKTNERIQTNKPPAAPDKLAGPDKSLAAKAVDQLLETEIIRIIAQILETESGRISTNENLLNLGFESISLLTLSQAFQAKFGVLVNPNTIYQYNTVEKLSGYIQSLQNRAEAG